MVRFKRAENVMMGAIEAANAIHKQDQVATEESKLECGKRFVLPLERIYARDEDTRPLREQHVRDLAESIASLGLIQPIVVDVKGVLLAGGHRLAAIRWMKLEDELSYRQHFQGGIPVRIMHFSADSEPERSLQIELAENEKRVNYSRDQIGKLAARLRELNYIETRGRPRANEKALGPALAVAIGVSTRYVRKVLNEQKGGEISSRNRVPILSRMKLLVKARSVLEELTKTKGTGSREDMAVDKAIPKFMDRIDGAIDFHASKQHGKLDWKERARQAEREPSSLKARAEASHELLEFE